ncbi:MAG: hypothetical protein IJ364_03395 [Oscillospiraceae bacterium]|nr:hypothetical protein [Oscillospiraceae bacterium]
MIALGIIICVLVLLLLIPVGVDGEYIGGELKLSAKVCGFYIQLIPQKPKKPKKEKKEKKQKTDSQPGNEAKAEKKKRKFKLSFNLEEILEIIKAALKAVGNFGKKLKVDRFLLHYTAAGKDPYSTAQTFGYVNAALSAMAPICAKRYRVRDCDVWTRVDFVEEKMSIDFALALSIRVGQILSVAFALLFKALYVFIKNKLRLRKERKQLLNNLNTEEGMN